MKFSFLLLCAIASGCGYSLENTKTQLEIEHNIRNVYVAPVLNKTYAPKVENYIYNELLRAIKSNDQIALAANMEDADSELVAVVSKAEYQPRSATSSDRLEPSGLGDSSIQIATSYTVRLEGYFYLNKINHRATRTIFDKSGSPEKLYSRALVWKKDFSRNKTFQANNQLGAFGTTNVLNNDSEFDYVLQELAQLMSRDVHENMLQAF